MVMQGEFIIFNPGLEVNTGHRGGEYGVEAKKASVDGSIGTVLGRGSLLPIGDHRA